MSLDEIMKALGPATSSKVAGLRWSGLVAWDRAEIPETYRKLIHEKTTWAAWATLGQIEKNPDLHSAFLDFDPNATFVDVPGFTNENGKQLAGGRLFFDAPKELR